MIHNVYLLKISSNWFCLVFSLESFVASYMKYIPGLLPFNLFLAIVRPWGIDFGFGIVVVVVVVIVVEISTVIYL